MGVSPNDIMIMTDDDVHAFMSEMDWIKQEVDDLQHELLNMESKRNRYRTLGRSWKKKFDDLTNSDVGIQLSNAHAEIDRLKYKNNALIAKLKEERKLHGISKS